MFVRRQKAVVIVATFAVAVMTVVGIRTLASPIEAAAASTTASIPVGYWLTTDTGDVVNYGEAGGHGSTQGVKLNKPVVGMAATPDSGGYWLGAADGGVFSFGDARFFGSAGNVHLVAPVVGLAATPDGKGYWLGAADGGVFTYGDARFFGSTGNVHLVAPVVGLAATPDGKGYWLAAADGGVFTFGDARFYGSAGDVHLDSPVVAMVATPDGGGYWLVDADGLVIKYGDANVYALAGGGPLDGPIVAMAATPDGKGYWLATADGKVFEYGDAPAYGYVGGGGPDGTVVGMAVAKRTVVTTPPTTTTTVPRTTTTTVPRSTTTSTSTTSTTSTTLPAAAVSWNSSEVSLPTTPDTDPDAILNGVTCTAVGSCVAVGDYKDSNQEFQGVIDTLSSGSWTSVVAPLPTGVSTTNPNVTLQSVACAATGACVAVGSYEDSNSHLQGLIETLASSTWTVSTAVLPSTATNPFVGLNSAACATGSSPVVCVAVGNYNDSSNHTQGLIESLSGSTWTDTKAPEGSGAATNPLVGLNSVACATSTSCAAVGAYTATEGYGLAETLSSGTWTASKIAPSGAAPDPEADLYSVSCPVSGSCVAAGMYNSSGTGGPVSQALLATLSSGTWAQTTITLPTGADSSPYADLTSVTCSSSGSCLAAGRYSDTSNDEQVLLETLASSTWMPTEGPSPANSGGELYTESASCASSSGCSAVGYYFGGASTNDQQGLLDSLSGGSSWATAEAVPPSESGDIGIELPSVSCPSATTCVAVGEYIDSNGLNQGLIEVEKAVVSV
jgi:hypothetical protein